MAPARSEIKDAVLAALLPEVPFDGWNKRTLLQAAERVGLDPADVTGLFPAGPRDAVAWFSHWADRQMLAALDPATLGEMKVRERIAAAVETRLRILVAHREAVRRSLALLAEPQNVILGARLLYDAVDAIWYAAGDTATDFNFYTKRALLAAVYAATTLYWLDDRSEGGADTSAFLERRLGDAMQIPRVSARLRKLAARLPDPFLALRLARRR
ncbi:MAG TPA: COQ9 family protein [Stellaceae bacterium]|nr:COQ9 family protein [Stellaceae bacterium]